MLGLAVALAQTLALWCEDADTFVAEVGRPATTRPGPAFAPEDPAAVSSPPTQARPVGFNPIHPWLP